MRPKPIATECVACMFSPAPPNQHDLLRDFVLTPSLIHQILDSISRRSPAVYGMANSQGRLRLWIRPSSSRAHWSILIDCIVPHVDLRSRKNLTLGERVAGEPDRSGVSTPAEFRYFSLGLALDPAKIIDNQFDQDAIVWVGSDCIPQLIILR
jgi:hypothetical protein